METKKVVIFSLIAIALGFTVACSMGAERTHTTTPTATPLTITRKDALTPPTGYEYAYKPNGSNIFELQDGAGVMLSRPTYNKTADGSYWNYATVNPITPVSGLSISLTFRHSNTYWLDPANTGYSGWVPAPPTPYAIGSDSTVGTVEKMYFIFDNQTNKDYKLTFDFSAIGSSLVAYPTTQKNGVSVGNGYCVFLSTSLGYNNVFLMSKTKIVFQFDALSAARYFNAFYLDDLGVSSAYTNGYNTGSSEGYSSGYGVGYEAGQEDPTTSVISSYVEVGYEIGYADGSSEAFDDGYDSGYIDGVDDGIAQGLELGITNGNFFKGLWDSLSSILGLQILPGITLGMLILIPIAFGLLALFFKLGGK